MSWTDTCGNCDYHRADCECRFGYKSVRTQTCCRNCGSPGPCPCGCLADESPLKDNYCQYCGWATKSCKCNPEEKLRRNAL